MQPVFANPSHKVVRLMRAAGLHDLVGEEFITVRMNDAVLLCQARTFPPKSVSWGDPGVCLFTQGRQSWRCLTCRCTRVSFTGIRV